MSIRFCVRDTKDRRSAMWSLFTMGSDVGLATTEASGLMKVNLHHSESWQIGYTSEYEQRQRDAGSWTSASRHWQIWKRPAEVQPGYTAAIKILVPPVALHQRAAPKKSKPVRWVDAREDRGVVFTIWLAKSSIPPWGYGGDQNDLLGTVPLPTGEYVLIGSHYVDANDATTVMLKVSAASSRR